MQANFGPGQGAGDSVVTSERDLMGFNRSLLSSDPDSEPVINQEEVQLQFQESDEERNKKKEEEETKNSDDCDLGFCDCCPDCDCCDTEWCEKCCDSCAACEECDCNCCEAFCTCCGGFCELFACCAD